MNKRKQKSNPQVKTSPPKKGQHQKNISNKMKRINKMGGAYGRSK